MNSLSDGHPPTLSSLPPSKIQHFLESLKNKRVSSNLLSQKEDSSAFDHLFEETLEHPLAPFIIQALPPQLLWQQLCHKGLEECGDWIQHLTGPMLTRVWDFDLWKEREGKESQLDGQRFCQWLRVWQENHPRLGSSLFLEQDEEMILLLLGTFFEIVPIGVHWEERNMEDNPHFIKTPDNRFLVGLKQDWEQESDILFQFLMETYAYNMKLTGSALAHSSMGIKAETEEMALKWRQGRMADLGYVTKEEAGNALRYRPIAAFPLTAQDTFLNLKPLPFLEDYDLAENYTHMLKQLSNPGSIFSYLPAGKALLEKSQLVSDQNPFPHESVLEDEDYQELTHSIIDEIRGPVSLCLQHYLRISTNEKTSLFIDDVFSLLWEEDRNDHLGLKSRLAKLANTLCSFLGDMEKTSLLALNIVKGLLNIGLQEHTEDPILACQYLKTYGPENFFYYAWNHLLEKRLHIFMAVQKYVGDPHNIPAGVHLQWEDQKIWVPLDRLLKTHRYPDLLTWIDHVAPYLQSQELAFLQALAQPVPTLLEGKDKNFHHIPFTDKKQWIILDEFILNLQRERT